MVGLLAEGPLRQEICRVCQDKQTGRDRWQSNKQMAVWKPVTGAGGAAQRAEQDSPPKCGKEHETIHSVLTG